MASTNNSHPFLLIITLLLLLLFSATLVSSECTCDSEDSTKDDDKSETKKLRIASFFVILIASCIGISLPVLGKNIPALSPESNIFFMVKAFAAGVILATGFIHVLPDAFEELTSPCLSDHPWHKFPFGGFVAMLGAIGSLMIDAGATGYFRRMRISNKGSSVGGGGAGDEETSTEAGQVGAHTHGSHGGGENLASRLELIRHRVTSQVLELGIMVHSVIIGITIGTSQSIKTIRTLMVALAFHQFFEGMGLGGCIAQGANEKLKYGCYCGDLWMSDLRAHRYLAISSFIGVLHLQYMQLDGPLIATLVKRRCPETHTFHMGVGEMTIMLEDMAMMLGLPIGGIPIAGMEGMDHSQMCAHVFGLEVTDIDIKALVMGEDSHGNSNYVTH